MTMFHFVARLPPAERGLSPRTVPGLELAHTHISTHTKSSLRLLYFRQKKEKKKKTFPAQFASCHHAETPVPLGRFEACGGQRFR